MAKKEAKRRKEIDDPDLKKVLRRIASNIKRLKSEDDTLQQVASRAGIATSTLWELANEKAFNMKLHTLIVVARALDTDLFDLLK